MKHYIYKLTNIETGKSYIGETKDYKRRKWEHFNFIKKGKVQENGLYEGDVDSWFFEVLEECDSSKKYERESYWIHQCNSIEKGYNIGDASSKPHSEESKRKISEAHMGKHLSNETKKKLSDYRKGKKHTEEECEKISKSTKEAFQRPEVKEALKKGKERFRVDTKRYEESKKRQGDSLKQYYVDNPEARNKLGHRKKVYMYDKEGNLIKVFSSITKTLDFLGIKGHSALDKAIKNSTIYKDYYWKKDE